MDEAKPTSNKSQMRSFTNAFRGISVALRESGHLKFHFLAAATVAVAGWILGISSLEWLAIVLVMCAVISVEIINTCVEDIENILRKQVGVNYEYTGKSKDMAAGAVLVCAVVAVIVGAIIFLPKLL